MKNILTGLIVLSIILSVMLLIIPSESSAYTPHAPIRIDKRVDFILQGFPGSGILSDPWLINGYSINGNGIGDCIYIGNTTDYVIISNSNLEWAINPEPRAYNSNAGIHIYNASNINIYNCTLSHNGIGISIMYGNNILIDSSSIEYSESYGVDIYQMDSLNLFSNKIKSNSMGGLRSGDSNECEISFNEISENGWLALDFINVSYYQIMNNTIKSNENVLSISSMKNNEIYHNNILLNEHNTLGYSVAESVEYNHTFSNTYPRGGNYWDDYTGSDYYSGPEQNIPGGDGLGDTPYSIGLFHDDFPLMWPYDWEDNIDPVSNAGPDRWIGENTRIILNGNQSSDNANIVNYTWKISKGPYETTCYWVYPLCLFEEFGDYIVSLNVTDARGNWNTDTCVVHVNDTTNPNADAGSDQWIDEDNFVQFTGTGCSDNVGIVNYNWTFDDNGVITNISNLNSSYNFTEPGIYNVTLKVTDSAGNWDVDSLLVTVNDTTNPVANAGPDQMGLLGNVVTFDSSSCSDNGDIHNFSWSFNYNETNIILYGASPQFTFWTPGNYTIELTVIDKAGNSDGDALNIDIPGQASKIPGFTFELILLASMIGFVIFKKRK